ncbi:endonuclease/exonuclease/phosphatase family protein [Streptomyces iranensis]|uniref:endonuclease/exonuclease/phosphatase family protein n=1 Tax=Streptomyces iranensis TaxID=576784 RepID=UPI0039B7522C
MKDQPTELTIGTWNIGGGILGESHQIGSSAELDYHMARIQDWTPDILCLQEAHEFRDGQPGQAGLIGKSAGLDHQEISPISPSHLDPSADLSLGILSRHEIAGTHYVEFPNPGLSAEGPNGQHWILFDKGYQITEIRLPHTSMTVVNAHCFPLHYFGAQATDTDFTSLWADFAEDLLQARNNGPVIATIDLNFEPIEEVLGDIFGESGFRNAFGLTATTPKGMQQDYIIYSDSSVTLKETSVIQTEADHHYCQARFVI